MIPRKKIYLIGFMGSGKSTAGKNLAAILKWEFVDIDEMVEKYAGSTIPEIFQKEGEEYFRKMESEMLDRLKSTENVVISTGGGTPCFNDNMTLMLKTGLTIYIKMTPEQLFDRLSGSTDLRPLVKNLDNDQLRVFIEEKLKMREEWYAMSEITVDGICLDVSALLSLIKT
jgi:shikimate kinase